MWCGSQNEPWNSHLRARFGGNVMDLLLYLGYCWLFPGVQSSCPSSHQTFSHHTSSGFICAFRKCSPFRSFFFFLCWWMWLQKFCLVDLCIGLFQVKIILIMTFVILQMRSISIIVRSVGSGVCAWVQVLLCYLPSVWCGASDMASPCLHFLIHKMGRVLVSASPCCQRYVTGHNTI